MNEDDDDANGKKSNLDDKKGTSDKAIVLEKIKPLF